MSTDDMVTYRDPDTPGMAFGRPPTRPGRPRTAAGEPDLAAPPPGPDAGGTDPDHDADAASARPDAEVVHPGGGAVTDDGAAHVPDEGTAAEADERAARVVHDGAFRVDEDGTGNLAADGSGPVADRDAEVAHGGTGEEDALAAEPATATAETAAAPAPAPPGGEPALAADQVADLRRRWGAVQAGFVDDPRRAVEVADDILAEAVGALQAAIDTRRREVAEPWRDDPGASTDALLTAFQQYRAVFDRVLSA